ncbi:POZ domain-containing protein [Saitoella complicata NRRL Y-17804]|uniref:BTB domain-containing protein n=1 Tax=Saitoella complicata (strain BCRC 22490 / CBS 7301 / JCM 7358 / NBRC 10748 / NRRL Y-17804) TaxID=698492 RepID=A0A0E9NLH1_SAICN|nr:POZ domain-containing protein [Saitoella complicata NRRL Y-17804]ODQ50483.1 POZ domain-containing protein [Saitoella complicata NRRL Y-17804]GAO50260.1 hypothetical protein G7K_4392-t1 [Saitoella complicata NRRL Y-17804]
MSQIVHLDVGGTSFKTTYETLTFHNASNSFFPRLLHFSTDENFGSANSAIFIDRDPERFKVVLNYLRSGELQLPPHCTASAIASEADFFAIDGLKKEATALASPIGSAGASDVVDFATLHQQELWIIQTREDTPHNYIERKCLLRHPVFPSHSLFTISPTTGFSWVNSEYVYYHIKDSINWADSKDWHSTRPDVFHYEGLSAVDEEGWCWHWQGGQKLGLRYEGEENLNIRVAVMQRGKRMPHLTTGMDAPPRPLEF